MTVTVKLTPLDEQVLEHLATLVFTEKRPVCFLDFKHLSPSHGVIRNAFCRLRKLGKIAPAYPSNPAFYTLPGQPFVKSKPMTVRPYGGSKARHDPLVQTEIEKLPFEERALHDLRLLFNLPGAWDVLSTTTKHRLNPANKDITLEPFRSKDGRTEVRVTIHKTDNISVFVACSLHPIIEDHNGVVRLIVELTRAEDYLARELEQAAKDAGRSFDVAVPDPLTWTCKSYHLGRDSLQEYTGDRFNTTLDDMQGAFVRAYSKQFTDKRRRIRVERAEQPNKPLLEIVNTVIDHDRGAATP